MHEETRTVRRLNFPNGRGNWEKSKQSPAGDAARLSASASCPKPHRDPRRSAARSRFRTARAKRGRAWRTARFEQRHAEAETVVPEIGRRNVVVECRPNRPKCTKIAVESQNLLRPTVLTNAATHDGPYPPPTVDVIGVLADRRDPSEVRELAGADVGDERPVRRDDLLPIGPIEDMLDRLIARPFRAFPARVLP